MRRGLLLLCLIGVVIGLAARPTITAQAAKGTPNSVEFGYGARVQPGGPNAVDAVAVAANIRLDWIAVDWDWAAHWADPAASPDFSDLDPVMQAAADRGMAVTLGLTHAPDWAMTAAGPNPDLVSWFVVQLVGRYPTALQAVELFPSANTTAGWGAAPDPAQYAAVLLATKAATQAAGQSIYLPAGGITPLLPAAAQPGDLDDAQFLNGLYASAGAENLPIVTMRLPDITGDPLQMPSAQQPNTLRHYEDIRQVMLANNHSSGILWITHLTSPADAQDPSAWLLQAYQQARAQLYLGVVFYHSLNPAPSGQVGNVGDTNSLLRADRAQHPFLDVLRQLIAQNNRQWQPTLQRNETQVKRLHKQRN